jgi:hypothetical protein
MRGSMLKTFREIAAEPDLEKRREACLAYLEHVWEEAKIGRTYTNKHGDVSTVPDIGVQRDIAMALPELMGVPAVESRQGGTVTPFAALRKFGAQPKKVG